MDIPIPAGASGEVTAFITGLRVNTNAPLSGGDACYIPAYGWHPKHIQAEISDASLGSSGDVVTATVELAFDATNRFLACGTTNSHIKVFDLA